MVIIIITITGWNDTKEQRTLCGKELGEYEKYDNEADRLKIKIKEMQDNVRRKSNQVQDKRFLNYSSSFQTRIWFVKKLASIITLRRPLCRKLRKSWFFDVSKVNESSFF